MQVLPSWAWVVITLGITATWVMLNVADVLSANYAISDAAHVVMGSVVGATGGVAAVTKSRRQRQEENDS